MGLVQETPVWTHSRPITTISFSTIYNDEEVLMTGADLSYESYTALQKYLGD